MKWLAFTAVCVVALVALGILAVDERNVAWEGRTPHCPYCRSDLPLLAVVCPQCRRAVDWVGTTESCTWCLNAADVDNLQDRFEALQIGDGPLPESLRAFPKGYFHVMEPGACAYCAGLKTVEEDGVRKPCPVCRGEGHCPACGGDRTIEMGTEVERRRKLERLRAHQEGERRERLTGLPLQHSMLIDEDVKELRGFAAAEEIRDEEGDTLVDRARQRLVDAFAALAEESRKRAAASASAGSRDAG